MIGPLWPFSFERVVQAVERVKQRLIRAVRAFEAAGVPHAVVGGHAVAAWVSRVDESATRNTPDVDILIRRSDLEDASTALAAAGFVAKSINVFLDGPGARDRDAVHLIFAGEKVRTDDLLPAPDLEESEPDESFRVVTLPALIRMKLTSFRLKDKVHLLDLIEVGLIDQSIVTTLPPELSTRLQELIDNPDS